MKKILLGGVSILAIIATTNANAAGYTCEELIEYTSCNDGYVLTSDDWTGKCVEVPTCNAGSFANASCPDDYWLATGVCETSGEPYYSKDSCENNGGTWYDMLCAPNGSDPDDTTVATLPVSYACSACPATGLTDKDGKTVVATTAGAGATSPAACYVGSEYYFTDTKGTYHYTDDCKIFDLSGIKTVADCEWLAKATGEQWEGGEGSASPFCYLNAVSTSVVSTESECLGIDGTSFHDGICECAYESWYIQDGVLTCEV